MENFNTFSLGLLLDRVHTAMITKLNQKLKGYKLDITPAQYIILKRINQKEGITQKQLSLMIRKDQAAINRSVKSLIELGYLKRGETSKDYNKLFATKKSLELKEIIIKIITEITEESLEGIPESRRQQGITFLKKIYKNVCVTPPQSNYNNLITN